MDPAVAALVLTGPAEADPPSAVCRASTPPVVTSRACHRGSLSRLPSLSCAAPEVLPAAVVAGLTARRRYRVPRWRCRSPPAAVCRASCRPPPVAVVRCAHCCALRQLPPTVVAQTPTAVRRASCRLPPCVAPATAHRGAPRRLPPLPASEWDRRGEEVREDKDEKFWNVVEGKRWGNLDFR